MMNNAQLATASLNDIVFDGRNQGYGAYELRALYQRHVTRALVIAVAMCALLLVFPLVAKLLEDKSPVAKTITHGTATPISPPLMPDVFTPPPPAAKPPTAPPRLPTVKDLVPVVVEDKKAPEVSDVPNRADLTDKNTGTKNIEGDSKGIEGPFDGLEPGAEEVVTRPEVDKKVYISVEQMPELPGGGGQEAIVAAIQRAVKYPGSALRAGVEGRVYVNFTVNAQGEIVDLKIVKGLGSGLDEETLRAIKSLPKFIPGRQNGREVSVSFTVPITYKIQ